MSKRRATLEEGEVACRQLAEALNETMPEGWGFTLILFSYGEDGFSTYISTAQRADMVASLRELCDKLEQGAPQA